MHLIRSRSSDSIKLGSGGNVPWKCGTSFATNKGIRKLMQIMCFTLCKEGGWMTCSAQVILFVSPLGLSSCKAHSFVQLMKSKEMINTFGAGGQKFLLVGWAGIWDFSLQVCRQPTFYMYLMIVHFASKLCLEEMFKSIVSLDDVIS